MEIVSLYVMCSRLCNSKLEHQQFSIISKIRLIPSVSFSLQAMLVCHRVTFSLEDWCGILMTTLKSSHFISVDKPATSLLIKI